MNNPKSLLATPTFWSAVLTVTLAMSLSTTDIIPKSIAKWLGVFNVGIAATLNVLERYNEHSEIYTPKKLPGRDKPKY